MRTEIARLQQRLGVTTVYVTHDQVEAMTLGDRVAVLRKGELQQVDTPRVLYERPVNLFVAGFIGSPSMNLLPAAAFPVVSLDCLSDEGRDLVVGIRPEHLEDEALVDPAVRDHGIAFEVEVEAVEWLGAEQFVYVPWKAPGNSSNRSSVSPPNWIGSRPVSGWWRGSTRGAPSPGERWPGCGSTPPTCTCSMRGRVNGSRLLGSGSMCRSIKTLRGNEPTAEEVRAAALQFVRKVSGYRAPSKTNEAVFSAAVDEIEAAAERLLAGLAPPRVTQSAKATG